MPVDRLKPIITDIVLDAIGQNPLGLTLGMLRNQVLTSSDPQISTLSKTALYHRIMRALKRLEEEGLVRKVGLTYRADDRQARNKALVETFLGKLFQEHPETIGDLKGLRAALDDVEFEAIAERVKEPGPRKPGARPRKA